MSDSGPPTPVQGGGVIFLAAYIRTASKTATFEKKMNLKRKGLFCYPLPGLTHFCACRQEPGRACTLGSAEGKLVGPDPSSGDKMVRG